MRPLLVVLFAAAILGCRPATPEEEAVAVAREYLAECEARDFDAAWDLAATPYRNLWIEVHEELRRESPVRYYFLPHAEILERELTRPVALSLSPRGLHAALMAKVVAGGEGYLPPEDAPHRVTIEGDLAEVSWPERDQRVFLCREDAAWRVEATGPASCGGVWRHEGPGGRMLSRFAIVELVRDMYFEGFPLPRLPAAREVDEGGEWIVALRLAEEGAIWVKGIEFRDGKRIAPPRPPEDGMARIKSVGYDDERLEQVLMRFADTKRDMYDPSEPSMVRLALGFHRDAPWTATESLLRLVALPPLCYRRVELVTEETDWGWEGVPARLFGRRVDIRQEEPRFTVVVGRAPGDGAGLLAAVRALPPERLKGGVRARLSAKLRSEDALRALVVIAAAEPEWIVVETVEEGADRLLVDGAPVAAAPGPLPDLGEVVVPLTFEYRGEGK